VIGGIQWSIPENKNQANIFYKNRVIAYFVSNFVAMATRVGRGRIRFRLVAFNGPFSKSSV